MNNFFGLFDLGVNQFYLFILVLARIGGVFVFDPVYGSRNVPMQVKVAFSVMFALAVFPVVQGGVALPAGMIPYTLAILKEFFIGASLGFTVAVVFAAVEFAGQIVGFNTGLSIANTVDPTYGTQVTVIARLKFILAVLIFFSINGHNWIIEALVRSYSMGSTATFQYPPTFVEYLIGITGDMFAAAVRISAPVTVTVIVLNTGLGILSRTIPQMNVFVVGFPLQIGVGLLTMGLSLFIISYVIQHLFGGIRADMYVVLKSLLGGAHG